MKCSICHKEIPDDSVFCEFCGARIDSTNEIILESLFLRGGKLTLLEREQLARGTQNESIINVLKHDESIEVLSSLLENPFISNEVKLFIRNRNIVENNNSEKPNETDDEDKDSRLAIILFIILAIIIVSMSYLVMSA